MGTVCWPATGAGRRGTSSPGPRPALWGCTALGTRLQNGGGEVPWDPKWPLHTVFSLNPAQANTLSGPNLQVGLQTTCPGRGLFHLKGRRRGHSCQSLLWVPSACPLPGGLGCVWRASSCRSGLSWTLGGATLLRHPQASGHAPPPTMPHLPREGQPPQGSGPLGPSGLGDLPRQLHGPQRAAYTPPGGGGRANVQWHRQFPLPAG